MTDWWPWLRDFGRKHLAGILAAVAVVGLVHFDRLEDLEHWSLAQLFEWRGKREPTIPVVIVTIDEATFAELGEQWPFARARHAELLRHLGLGQPRVIAFDVIFEGASSRGPHDDEVFAEAVASARNVVLSAAYTTDSQPGTAREIFVMPLPTIRRGAAAV